MRKIAALAVAALSLSLTPVAFAASPSMTGELLVKHQRDTADGEPATSGMVYTLTLKSEAELGNGWSLFARLGAQHATRPSLGDLNLDAYGADQKSAVALDQFGLTYKTEKLTYKLGRQDAAVGTTALLYSRPYTNIGKKAFVDGLSVTGTVGALDITALMAQEDSVGSQDSKVYALRAGYSLQENLNWGITLGRYQNASGESTNHWALDSTYKFGKNSLTAEYTKSSSSTHNMAYAAAWNYAFDGKTSLTVIGFKVEENGDMGRQSDFDNNNRGIHYKLNHKLSDSYGLEFVFKDQKTISDARKNTSFEATLAYTF